MTSLETVPPAHLNHAAVRRRQRPPLVGFGNVSGGLMAWLFAAVVSAFILQYSIYLVHSVTWDRIIKMGSLVFLAALFPYYRFPRKFGITLLLWASLLGTALAGALSQLDPVGVAQLAKLALAVLILPLVVLRVRPGERPPPLLTKLMIFWGFLFAVQALALWILVLQYRPPQRTVIYLERLGGMPEASLGIFGYSNALGWMREGFFFFRPQGWFLEPSNLASFLLYPTFVSFGIYLSTRRLRYLIIAAVCGAGLLFAFSLAGYMAFVAGALVVLLVRRRKSRRRSWFSYVAPVAAGVAFLIAANSLMSAMHHIHQEGSRTGYSRVIYLLGRDPGSQSLVQSYWRVDETLVLLRSHPLGIGLGNTRGESETTSANAFVYWVVAGGIPGILVVLLLHAHFFYAYCLPALLGPIALYRYLAGAYVAISVHALSYGTWTTPFYLLSAALVVIAAGHVRAIESGRRARRAS